MDILILGGSGQVGTELKRRRWPAGITIHAPDRKELNFADDQCLERWLSGRHWECVVNVAAFTAVNRAESDVAAAWRINALSPAILAAMTAKTGTPVVHVSTDYVFDGRKEQSYRSTDPVGPLNVYGASKEGGEQAIRTANKQHVIVRTAWVVSAHRANFLKTILRLAQERDVLRVVRDQQGSPTSAADLAEALQGIALGIVDGKPAHWGTYHFVNSGPTNWYEFAREIMACAARRGLPTVPVEPLTTAEYPTPARRPANSVLDTTSLTEAYGVRPRPWQKAICDIVDELVPEVTID